ncbi:hypothetical protein SAMN02910413_0319 [Pseudobutyrivibrio sp. C4]|uniref:hypothetical protein n=1 Tax=Pseudobutyrivibrio sp. C4 TaxID=1520803 RepID=UPI0008AE256E|nr:hypothetical protein [Pseudobutyrivibrio sp. C4]SES65729.1 hypothetical protein SAMN02910413_0319 [Pseudobutyrivibrio sp. C4]
MAWGYEKGFSIEHLPKEKKKLSCSDCDFYDVADKSCGKSPRYLPVDGYDSWKYCGEFLLNTKVSYCEEKERQYNAWIRKKAARDSSTDGKSQKNNTKKSLIINENKKVTSQYQRIKTDYANYAHETHVDIIYISKDSIVSRKTKHPIITKEERDTLKLVECNTKSELPKSRIKKALVIRYSSGEERILMVYICGQYAYYINKNYDPNYVKDIRGAFKHLEN